MEVKRLRVLVHCCCGPCAAYPVDALTAEGASLHLYFYNPNVHPYQEFERRLEAVRTLALKKGLPLIEDPGYNLEEWLRMVVFRESQRCTLCYGKRLEAAARIARKGKFDAFTTTLLYSRQQKHEKIRDMAEAAAEEAGVKFLYRDFRTGWKAGIQSSKEMGLYRQQYCGCVYSERDRFLGPPPREGEGLN